MKRLPCEVCGNVKSEAHHDDYSKPYDVRFLCREHHILYHQQTDYKKVSHMMNAEHTLNTLNISRL